MTRSDKIAITKIGSSTLVHKIYREESVLNTVLQWKDAASVTGQKKNCPCPLYTWWITAEPKGISAVWTLVTENHLGLFSALHAILLFSCLFICCPLPLLSLFWLIISHFYLLPLLLFSLVALKDIPNFAASKTTHYLPDVFGTRSWVEPSAISLTHHSLLL